MSRRIGIVFDNDHDEQAAEAQEARLEGGQDRDGEGCVRPVGLREGDAQQDEAEGREAEPEPLALADLEAEHAVRHDGEEHEAAGEDRLDDRQRSQGDGRHVEDPGTGTDAHADGEPGLTPERRAGLQRVLDVDRRSRAGTTVLVEEREVRREGAGEREEDAQVEGQEISVGVVRGAGRRGVRRADAALLQSASR